MAVGIGIESVHNAVIGVVLIHVILLTVVVVVVVLAVASRRGDAAPTSNRAAIDEDSCPSGGMHRTTS